MTAASRNAPSGSPTTWTMRPATLLGVSSCTRGLSGLTASRRPTTGGRSSSSTTTSSSASSATYLDSATTMATTWPTKLTSLSASGCCVRGCASSGWGKIRGRGRPSAPSAAWSKTASTPLRLFAAERSTPRSRACATGLRTKATWAAPGRSTSSRNRPRPSSSRASSVRRIGFPKTRVIPLLSIQPLGAGFRLLLYRPRRSLGRRR